LKKLEGHSNSVNSVDISPDISKFLSAKSHLLQNPIPLSKEFFESSSLRCIMVLGTSCAGLILRNASFLDVKGLSNLNENLLKQRK
jgi:hypothetical protein